MSAGHLSEQRVFEPWAGPVEDWRRTGGSSHMRRSDACSLPMASPCKHKSPVGSKASLKTSCFVHIHWAKPACQELAADPWARGSVCVCVGLELFSVSSHCCSDQAGVIFIPVCALAVWHSHTGSLLTVWGTSYETQCTQFHLVWTGMNPHIAAYNSGLFTITRRKCIIHTVCITVDAKPAAECVLLICIVICWCCFGWKREDLLLFFVLCDSKWKSLGFVLLSETKQANLKTLPQAFEKLCHFTDQLTY